MKRIAVTIYVLGCLACGSSAPPKTPIDKCEDLRSGICDRFFACEPTLFFSQLDCVEQFTGLLPCAKVTAVGAMYDACVAAVKSATCATEFPPDPMDPTAVDIALPTVCMQVIMSMRDSDPDSWSLMSSAWLMSGLQQTAEP